MDLFPLLSVIENYVSGFEPTYEPHVWDSQNVGHANCYSYATNNAKYQNKKPIPGNNIKDYTCDELEKSLSRSHLLYKSNENTPCRTGFSKIYTSISPHEDFHLYRQDIDGSWSHKRGIYPIEKVDASNNPIIHPHLADKNYSDRVYNNCGYYCLQRNLKN